VSRRPRIAGVSTERLADEPTNVLAAPHHYFGGNL
jgi:hypothetical protein